MLKEVTRKGWALSKSGRGRLPSRQRRPCPRVLNRTDTCSDVPHAGVRRLVDRLRPCDGEMNLKGSITMLYTIAVILLVAWLLGIVGTYTIGAFVHVLLVVAIVLFVVGLLSGRRSLT
jgi:Family of unknown function (DUF5670)